MSDVCLCYATEDHKKMTGLVALLKEEGKLSVSLALPLEHTIPQLAGLVAQMVEGATVVVVLWSKAASESAFLREMRKRAKRDFTLVALLEKIEPPSEEEHAGVIDLSGWDGVASHAGLTSLLRHLRALITARQARPAGGPPASLEELSLSEIKENARLGLKEGAEERPEGGGRFNGVFISYRRDEASAYAGRLYDRLAARFGKEKVFFDAEDVGWGEDFVDIITAAAESCAVMIALVSRGWARGPGNHAGADDYVRLEVATALGRKVRVIPIFIQDAEMPAAKELPEDLWPLLRRNGLALTDTRWDRDVEDLIKTLEGLLKA